MSSAVSLPNFDYFSKEPVSNQIEESFINEIRPIAPISQNKSIDFILQPATDQFLNLNELYVSVKVKLKSPTELKKSEWNNIDICNNTLHSLFKEVDLIINGKQLTSSQKTYMYKAYFNTLLDYSSNSKKTFLKACNWNDKSRGDFNVKTDRNRKFMPVLVNDTATASDGPEVELFGKLFLDLSKQIKALPGSNRIHIRLHPIESKFLILTNETVKDKNIQFEITDASLFVKIQKGASIFYKGLFEAFKQKSLELPITRHEVHQYVANSNITNINIDNAIYGQLPRRIFLSMVKTDSFNGNYTMNPFEFELFDLRYLAMYIDGVIKNPPYVLDNNTTKAYLSLYQSLHDDNENSIVDITQDEFNKGFGIFSFDLSPDGSEGYGSGTHVNPVKFGSIRFELIFKKPLEKAVTILLYCEYDNNIMIEFPNVIKTDYN